MATYSVGGAASLIFTARSVAASNAHARLVYSATAVRSTVANRSCLAKLTFSARAACKPLLSGDPTLLRTVLRSGVSPRYPFNFAEVPEGLLLLANGIDPMLRWDGSSAQAEVAGVPAPATAPTMWLTGFTLDARRDTTTSWSGGQDGAETISTVVTGNVNEFFAYVRFLDEHGNVSDFSPISGSALSFIPGYSDPLPTGFGINSVFKLFTYDSSGTIGQAVFGSGLDFNEGATAVQVSVEVLARDEIVAHFADFGITLPLAGATSVRQATYLDVPLPTGPYAEKVVRRQVLRNTAGQASTWYVDIDTTDLTSTTLVSDNTDEILLGNEAVPFQDDLGAPFANIHGFPPSHKAAIVAHLGRVFAAGEVTYDEGSLVVTSGSSIVQGVGTRFVPEFVGRLLYVRGAREAYLISRVNPVDQILVLEASYQGPSDLFAFYAIRPAPAERKLIYFTPAGLPESWPSFYALELVEDGDEITGLMALSSFLYILEKRHIYRFTFKDDPATDGAVFLSSLRGCLSQRLWVQAEESAFMLDEQGIHQFSGGESQPISEPIQDLFRDDSPSPLRVNWDADPRYWHACYSEVHATVRFFVAMTGNRYPRHAICYNYRAAKWWLEEYHRPVCSSCRANLGIARVLAGTDHREVIALNVGWTDGARAVAGSVRGAVTSRSAVSLTDSGATFAVDVTNLAVFLVTGRGKGQWRRVVRSRRTRLDLLTPWTILPAPGDGYIVGGIDWRWRGGWFRFADEVEIGNPRDVEVIFQPQPHGTMDLQLSYDHAESPRPWARATDGSVAITAGDPVAVVDMAVPSGRAIQRMEGHIDTYISGDRYVSPELSGVQAERPLRIFRVTINGVEEVG